MADKAKKIQVESPVAGLLVKTTNTSLKKDQITSKNEGTQVYQDYHQHFFAIAPPTRSFTSWHLS